MGYPVQVIAFGRRSDLWEGLVSEYAARLRPFLDLELRWLRPSARTQEEARLREEARRVESAVSPDHLRVVLDRRGEGVSTLELAARFRRWQRERPKGVAFLIGSDLGFAPELVSAAGWCWSLGPLTLPHQLARLVVLEQLYRVVTIEKGIQYHRSSF